MQADQRIEIRRQRRRVQVLIAARIEGPEHTSEVGVRRRRTGRVFFRAVDERLDFGFGVGMNGLTDRLFFHAVGLGRVIDRVPDLEADRPHAVALVQRVAERRGHHDAHEGEEERVARAHAAGEARQATSEARHATALRSIAGIGCGHEPTPQRHRRRDEREDREQPVGVAGRGEPDQRREDTGPQTQTEHRRHGHACGPIEAAS